MENRTVPFSFLDIFGKYGTIKIVLKVRKGGIMLELKNISFARDNKQILNNINLKIDNSKLIAITGPNGSGKSTLAKIIMGILKPDKRKYFV